MVWQTTSYLWKSRNYLCKVCSSQCNRTSRPCMVIRVHFYNKVPNHLLAPGRLVRRAWPVVWPPISPHLNLLFLWKQLKSLIYETLLETLYDLITLILDTAAAFTNTPGIFKRIRQSFHRRCRLSNDLRVSDFEKIL